MLRFWPFLLILPLLLLPLLLSPAAAGVEEAAAVQPDAAVSYYIAPLALAEVPQIGLLTDGGVVQLDAESYLIGVVAAEMPVSFAAEALAAQAVESISVRHISVQRNFFSIGQTFLSCVKITFVRREMRRVRFKFRALVLYYWQKKTPRKLACEERMAGL